MRKAVFVLLFGSSAFIAASALAQTMAHPSNVPAAIARPGCGPADLCKELLAYAEKEAAEPQELAARRAPAPVAAPPLRADGQESGTRVGGSVSPNASTETSSQAAAPPTIPASSGAAPEAASSPHGSDASGSGTATSQAGASGPSAEFKLPSGITVQRVRDIAKGGDCQVCRDMAQKMRRAVGDLPAALIALAAYEPDPAKRQ
jgi:hypothetical protein